MLSAGALVPGAPPPLCAPLSVGVALLVAVVVAVTGAWVSLSEREPLPEAQPCAVSAQNVASAIRARPEASAAEDTGTR
jgi:hypothetical protein